MKRDGKTVELSRLRTSLTECADKHGHNLELRSKSMKARLKKSVCGTFHGAGMVVPLDDNEVGYRELPETNGESTYVENGYVTIYIVNFIKFHVVFQ